jgi:Cu-Zn family superoxide dismutase
MYPKQDGIRLERLLRYRPTAVAVVEGSHSYPSINGTVKFYQTVYGVLVVTELEGLPVGKPNGLPIGRGMCEAPIFAFHIHDGNACTGNEADPFADAGVHLNPYQCPHPYHAGDLPPLFGANGMVFSVTLTDRFTVEEILGKTVIVHSSFDDFTTQPAGNAGSKIACGEIVAVNGGY